MVDVGGKEGKPDLFALLHEPHRPFSGDFQQAEVKTASEAWTSRRSLVRSFLFFPWASGRLQSAKINSAPWSTSSSHSRSPFFWFCRLPDLARPAFSFLSGIQNAHNKSTRRRARLRSSLGLSLLPLRLPLPTRLSCLVCAETGLVSLP